MKSVLLQGLAFGDESKGQTVASICGSFPVDQIIRFNGGPQTAHNYVGVDGVHHTFSQFGSGMIINPTVKTHLSRFMLINPLNMINEGNALNRLTANVWGRTTIDKKCVVITPMHKRLNQLREKSRSNPHGSCGQGVGAAREYHLKYGDEQSLLAGDLNDNNQVLRKLERILVNTLLEIRDLEYQTKSYREEYSLERFASWYSEFPGKIVDSLVPSEFMLFEGAQGVLLDERKEFLPHNTWTNCTFQNADTLLDEIGCEDRLRIGCFRTYFTRHGHGPFPTEDASLKEMLPEPHNGTGIYQGEFRVGRFDFELAKKALDIVGGVDFLSISHCDRTANQSITAYDMVDDLGCKLGIIGKGPTAKDRFFTEDLTNKLKCDSVLKEEKIYG